MCERTSDVSEAIAAALGKPCAGIAGADLASLGQLEVVPRSEALKPGDFSGLSNLGWLSISRARLGDDRSSAGLKLAPGLFDGLSRLRYLSLYFNDIGALPSGLFRDFSELRLLNLGGNRLAELKPGVFDGLVNLDRLVLARNELSSLPPGLFDGLTNLVELSLGRNQLTTLPLGLFDGLELFGSLVVSHNQLTTLPLGLFDGLELLSTLDVSHNRLTALEPDLLNGLGVRENFYLHLQGNRLTTLPAELFNGFSHLRLLDASKNQLATLPSGMFAGLPLQHLSLQGNQLTSLPYGLFEGLAELLTFGLSDNPGAPFALTLELAALPMADPSRGYSAAVVVEVASGVPYDVRADISASGGALSANSTLIRAGQIRGDRIAVLPRGNGPVIVKLDAVSDAPGGGNWACEPIHAGLLSEPCYRGVRTALGAPLVLYGFLDQTLAPSGVVRFDLPSAFPNLAGEASYAVELSNPAAVEATVREGLLIVSTTNGGETEVAVTATGPDGRRETRRFAVRALASPEAVGEMPSLSLVAGESVRVELSARFRDPDGGPLAYAAESADSAVAAASVDGGAVNIAGRAPGVASVTVTATDPDGLSAALTFTVTVEQPVGSLWGGWRSALLRPPPAAGGDGS